MAGRIINRVIVTGAGFSVPANLPMQSKIIEKMTEEPKQQYDFLSGVLPQESKKFLNAYITVGLFLLDNYGRGNYGDLSSAYTLLKHRKQAIDTVLDPKYFSLDKSARNGLLEISRGYNLDSESYYVTLYKLKEHIRQSIKNESININLEDIFTSFDKSVKSSEHVHKYTYTQMDEIRYSIMRLFIYYFSKSVKDHSFKQEEYVRFFRYVKTRKAKSPVTIITTNWDTLTEEYCTRNGIDYQYCFHTPYYESPTRDSKPGIFLLKIHGSANWLKCLNCGEITVLDTSKAAESLFEDDKQEYCAYCGQGKSYSSPSLQPEIITPTMIKTFSSRVYSNIWGAASAALRKATHVIFIGYSFPLADFDFRYILQKNIPANAQIDVILSNDDDPTQINNANLQRLLPEKRYRDAFPKNNLRFFYNGFSEYFR